jgi:ligand-binding SRPBCC domain-containing protein
MHDFAFSIQSEVNTTKEILWQHITQMKNVNAELMPYAKMTYPHDKNEIGNREVPVNQVLFKSVILLLGFIPIDVHYLRLDKLVFGEAFYENSYSLQHHYWKHTRTIIEKSGKVALRDDLQFLPRITFCGYILLPIYKLIFYNRHQKLTKHFRLSTA